MMDNSRDLNDTLKGISKAILVVLGAAILVGTCYGIDYGCRNCGSKHRTHQEYGTLFSGEVSLKAVNKRKNGGCRGYELESRTLYLKIMKPGKYIFEVWQAQYRTKDKMVRRWRLDVKKPGKYSVTFHEEFYRVEASRYVGGHLQNDSSRF